VGAKTASGAKRDDDQAHAFAENSFGCLLGVISQERLAIKRVSTI
jgi:hypothetical protein